ncbi:hypothetical protein DX933_16240 [Ornithinibacillus gellani]|uniref:hypothetical protein n=1 Tax=Ornithinibacillus gellani TaxID=2293253 RepID=UPI0011AB706B|nr:hypothetical protein [Ornithinibacillus gellani]TQS71220.1 hypothetical protein DX933_16240 [Ornithinibacillus gellani]
MGEEVLLVEMRMESAFADSFFFNFLREAMCDFTETPTMLKSAGADFFPMNATTSQLEFFHPVKYKNIIEIASRRSLPYIHDAEIGDARFHLLFSNVVLFWVFGEGL